MNWPIMGWRRTQGAMLKGAPSWLQQMRFDAAKIALKTLSMSAMGIYRQLTL
jgi:hypothetical protein